MNPGVTTRPVASITGVFGGIVEEDGAITPLSMSKSATSCLPVEGSTIRPPFMRHEFCGIQVIACDESINNILPDDSRKL